MQSGKYGVDIVIDGAVVQERADGVLAVPFGKDYEIRLRNDDHRRAVAQIYVDETNVSGDGFVVDGRSSWSIKRPVDKAVTFRIASSHSQEAAEHGKAGEDVHGEKGLIRVEWRAELYPSYQPPVRRNTLSRSFNPHFLFTCDSDVSKSVEPTRLWKLGDTDTIAMNCSNTLDAFSLEKQTNVPVVTIEGSYSSQQFVDVETGPLDPKPVVILLKMRGYALEQGVPANGTNYCPACRTKTMKPTDKFCRNCGERLSGPCRSSLGKPC